MCLIIYLISTHNIRFPIKSSGRQIMHMIYIQINQTSSKLSVRYECHLCYKKSCPVLISSIYGQDFFNVQYVHARL